MIDERKIKEIVERIVKAVDPEKIILFGSYANNRQNEDSDLDILIIKNNSSFKSYEIRKMIVDFKIPVDVIIKSEDEFNKYKEIIGTICYPANKFGKIIYERNN